MSSKTTLPIVTALCASAALIGYTFYQRHSGRSVAISPVTLGVVVAIISLVPATYDIFRSMRNRNKTPKVRE